MTQKRITIPGVNPGLALSNILSHNPPKVLYHYTRTEGLYGIVQSKEIWASNIHYLNDSQEYALTLQFCKDMLEGLAFKADKVLKKLLKAMSNSLECIDSVNIFVCSFSANGDLLSQWRAYCSGGGYSIGFCTESLRNLAKTQKFKLAPCVYDYHSQKVIVSSIIDDHLQIFERKYQTHPKELNSIIKLISERFSNTIYYIAPLIKHSSFAEEAEWRLFCLPTSCVSDAVGYRPNGAMITPYYKFQLSEQEKPLYLKSIRIGPMPHTELATKSLVGFLSQQKVEWGFCTASEIPYREW